MNSTKENTEYGPFYILNGIAHPIKSSIMEYYSFISSALKNTEKFALEAIEHILGGEIAKEPGDNATKVKFNGCHSNLAEYNPIIRLKGKKESIEYRNIKTDAYQGQVDGTYKNLPLYKKVQSWFPEEWNAQKIIDSIVEVAENGIGKLEERPGLTGMVVGFVENICIVVRINKKTGEIETAYPVEQRIYDNNFKKFEGDIPTLKIPENETNRDEDKPINNEPEEGSGEDENNEPEEAL